MPDEINFVVNVLLLKIIFFFQKTESDTSTESVDTSNKLVYESRDIGFVVIRGNW
jgi:hypothetical protein